MPHFITGCSIKVFALVLFANVTIAQTVLIDSCGLDNKSLLNKYEAEYFNETEKGWNFNFQGKRIAFVYGNYGSSKITKREYFDRWGRDYYKRNSSVSNQLLLLNSTGRVSSGGYDAIIVSWSKVRIGDTSKRQIIKRLHSITVFHEEKNNK